MVTYGVSFVRSSNKNDWGISRAHCIEMPWCPCDITAIVMDLKEVTFPTAAMQVCICVIIAGFRQGIWKWDWRTQNCWRMGTGREKYCPEIMLTISRSKMWSPVTQQFFWIINTNISNKSIKPWQIGISDPCTSFINKEWGYHGASYSLEYGQVII